MNKKLDDTCCVDGRDVVIREILERVGARYPESAQDILRLFNHLHLEEFGKAIEPNRRHLILMQYQSDKVLPDFVIKAYRAKIAKQVP